MVACGFLEGLEVVRYVCDNRLYVLPLLLFTLTFHKANVVHSLWVLGAMSDMTRTSCTQFSTFSLIHLSSSVAFPTNPPRYRSPLEYCMWSPRRSNSSRAHASSSAFANVCTLGRLRMIALPRPFLLQKLEATCCICCLS